MTLEIAKQAREQAIASIERYFLENMDENIGNITAGAMLGFSWRRLARWSTTRR